MLATQRNGLTSLSETSCAQCDKTQMIPTIGDMLPPIERLRITRLISTVSQWFYLKTKHKRRWESRKKTMRFCLLIWQLTKKSEEWTVSENSVSSRTDSKGLYRSGVRLLWPSLVTKWPRLILGVSGERKHLTSRRPRTTARCFSLRSPDGQKTRVCQAGDEKNATALKALNSGTACTGVPITQHLRKPDP